MLIWESQIRELIKHKNWESGNKEKKRSLKKKRARKLTTTTMTHNHRQTPPFKCLKPPPLSCLKPPPRTTTVVSQNTKSPAKHHNLYFQLVTLRYHSITQPLRSLKSHIEHHLICNSLIPWFMFVYNSMLPIKVCLSF